VPATYAQKAVRRYADGHLARVGDIPVPLEAVNDKACRDHPLPDLDMRNLDRLSLPKPLLTTPTNHKIVARTSAGWEMSGVRRSPKIFNGPQNVKTPDRSSSSTPGAIIPRHCRGS
jgi:hypothetical protein